MESNADERARERAEAVEERMREVLAENKSYFGWLFCPDCDCTVFDREPAIASHLATCELLRARAEAEVDRG